MARHRRPRRGRRRRHADAGCTSSSASSSNDRAAGSCATDPRPLPIAATVAELEPGVADVRRGDARTPARQRTRLARVVPLRPDRARRSRASSRSGSPGSSRSPARSTSSTSPSRPAVRSSRSPRCGARSATGSVSTGCATASSTTCPRDDRWDALARSALREDARGRAPPALVDAVLAVAPGLPADDALDRWIAQHPGIVARVRVLDDIEKKANFDVATLSVALRELRNPRQVETTR